MELFYNDGHLTDQGLQAAMQEGLNELECLEASEHLGYCAPCLERYLIQLEAVPLLAPLAPLKDHVLRRVGRKAKRLLFSRYATVAAAACLVLLMGGSGLYTSMLTPPEKSTAPAASQAQRWQSDPNQPSLATKLSQAAVGLPGAFGDLFSWLAPEGTTENSQTSANQPTSQPNVSGANSEEKPG